MQKVYRNALQDMLRGLDGSKNVKGGQDWGKSRILTDLPLKFRNVSIIYGPQNSYLVAGVHWGEVYGSFHRQAAPATAMVLSDRYLMIIAEEKPARWFQFRAESHYGEIITYFPLDRLAKFEIRRTGRFSVLELEGRRVDGGEKLQLLFPLEREAALLNLMGKALSISRTVGDPQDNSLYSEEKTQRAVH